jgi:hypothetical protein
VETPALDVCSLACVTPHGDRGEVLGRTIADKNAGGLESFRAGLRPLLGFECVPKAYVLKTWLQCCSERQDLREVIGS